MSSGLLSLLDDVAAIAKAAAASIDDAAGMAAKAGSKAMSKAAGIVIDDAAVTPRYVVGFAAQRELPIIGKIAFGSLKNKLLLLLPGALVLSLVAPWTITPLLMFGGAFLCLEGYEKVVDLIKPRSVAAEVEKAPGLTPEAEEEAKIKSAIRTDFILSAEIMAITLSTVATASTWLQAVVLAVVGIGMTALVYGAVAIIVKADDVGAAMAGGGNAAGRVMGRSIVKGMPILLKTLSLIGMVAMLWVGGGILVHGLHELGVHGPEELIQGWAKAVAASLPVIEGFLHWLVAAGISAVIGVAVGALCEPIVHHLIAPLLDRFKKKPAGT